MLGSVIAALVCLQASAPTDVQELANFREVAAKPEWSMGDLDLLARALSSKFGSVRNEALRFWPHSFDVASEDFRYMNQIDGPGGSHLWESILQSRYTTLLRAGDPKLTTEVIFSLLASGPPPTKPVTNDSGEPSSILGWASEVINRIPNRLQYLEAICESTDPVVAFNAFNILPADSYRRRSKSLKQKLKSKDPAQVVIALRHLRFESPMQAFGSTMHLWNDPSPDVRAALVDLIQREKLPGRVLVQEFKKLKVDSHRLPIYAAFQFGGVDAKSWLLSEIRCPNAEDRHDALAFTLANTGIIGDAQALADKSKPVRLLVIKYLMSLPSHNQDDLLEELWQLDPGEGFLRSELNTNAQRDHAISRLIRAMETGYEVDARVRSVMLSFSATTDVANLLAGSSERIALTGMYFIPPSQVGGKEQMLMKWVNAKSKTVKNMAGWLLAQSKDRDVRMWMFGLLPTFEIPPRNDIRDALCATDDPISREHLRVWRISGLREERMFSRKTLWRMDHPIRD